MDSSVSHCYIRQTCRGGVGRNKVKSDGDEYKGEKRERESVFDAFSQKSGYSIKCAKALHTEDEHLKMAKTFTPNATLKGYLIKKGRIVLSVFHLVDLNPFSLPWNTKDESLTNILAVFHN